MSLRFYLKVIYKSACEELCISQCQQPQKLGVGTTPNARKNPYLVLDFYVQDWRWMGSIFNSLTPKSVPAGTKLVLFGRYVLNIYVGIV